MDDDEIKKKKAAMKDRLEYKGEHKFASAEEKAETTKFMEAMEKESADCSVTFRWQKEQLDLVKQAADAIGVPYQTYIKLCVYRQAQQDLGRASPQDPELASAIKALTEITKTLIATKPISPPKQSM